MYVSTTWIFGDYFTVTYKYSVRYCECGYQMILATWSYIGTDADIKLTLDGEVHLCEC